MSRSSSNIAKQFTDILLKEHGEFTPKEVYGAIRSLEEHPDLSRIRLNAWAAEITEIKFRIVAKYTGQKAMLRYEADDAASEDAEKFFDALSQETGREFRKARALREFPPQYDAEVKIEKDTWMLVEIEQYMGRPAPT